MKVKLLFFNDETVPIGPIDQHDIELSAVYTAYGNHGHFGIGMNIRNIWGLWTDSRLKRWFFWRSISHPDIMSHIIMDEYIGHLRGEPVSNYHKNRIVSLLILAGITTLFLYITSVIVGGAVRVLRRRESTR